MSPPYIFKIDEIRENPGINPSVTRQGHWMPSTVRDYNYRSEEGISNTYWFCENHRIRSVPTESLPQPLNRFKTFSVFFSGGYGFWVLRGDGTAPGLDESWHPLRFEHGADGSSYLTPAGPEETLRCQRTDQLWTHMLLPSTYHGPQTENPRRGGLRGELPIFLALVAMSMEPTNLRQWLPWMFQTSKWQTHALPNGWAHKRGVVVEVYTCPRSWAGGSSAQELEQFENGALGKYYH